MMTDGMFQGDVPFEKQEKTLYGILWKNTENLTVKKLQIEPCAEMERRFRV